MWFAQAPNKLKIINHSHKDLTPERPILVYPPPDEFVAWKPWCRHEWNICCFVQLYRHGRHRNRNHGQRHRRRVQGTHLLTWVEWISNYIHFKVWYEIIYPFPIFNGAVEVLEWISNFSPHFIGHVITMLGLRLIHVSKRGPRSS